MKNVSVIKIILYKNLIIPLKKQKMHGLHICISKAWISTTEVVFTDSW